MKSIDPPAEIFKAYDIRGIVDNSLTTKGVNLIGQAVAHLINSSNPIANRKICVGRDGRHSGKEISEALIDGLRAESEISVFDIGQVTTPILYYAALTEYGGNGVMVTGSHNPPEYNGLKIMISGNSLSGPEIQEVYEYTKNLKEIRKNRKNIITADYADRYLKEIVQRVTLSRKIRVALDCGNGIAGAYAPQIFKALGCEVEELFCEVDGNFPNHHPDPSQPKNLKDLIKAVRKGSAELGLAFDGDGDRLGVVTKTGDIIFPDRQLMILAADVLKKNRGADIIFDVKCSSLLSKWIIKHGGKPIMHNTGHSLIKKKMKETQAPLAGEMSGHIFFKDRWFGFDDGIYAGARLLEVLSKQDDITETLRNLPDAISTPEIQIPLREGENHAFVKELMKTNKLSTAQNLIRIDGLRAEYKSGFGLVRASNTTPVLVLRFEAGSEGELRTIKKEFKSAIIDINPDISLPF